jgi:CHAT domain-containing protein
MRVNRLAVYRTILTLSRLISQSGCQCFHKRPTAVVVLTVVLLMIVLSVDPSMAVAQAAGDVSPPTGKPAYQMPDVASYVDQQLGFFWPRRQMVDGSVIYLHPIGGNDCTLVVKPARLTNTPDRDISQIRLDAEKSISGRALGRNTVSHMKDGSTIVSTSVVNGRNQADDLYIVIRPEAGAPDSILRAKMVQVLVYHQTNQTLCQADTAVSRAMRSLTSADVGSGHDSVGTTGAASNGADANLASSAVQDPLETARAARNAWVESVRRNGDPLPLLPRLNPIIATLQHLVDSTSGERQVQAKFELGVTQRQQFDFAAAEPTLTDAAKSAERLSLHDVAFKAWIELARTVTALRNHDKAEAALRSASDVAGEKPTPKERFDLALYNASALERRGEGEAALVEAIESRGLAQTAEDKFNSVSVIGDALNNLAWRCPDDPRLSINGSAGQYGKDACEFLFSLAGDVYKQAETEAEKLGWDGIARLHKTQADGAARQRDLLAFKSTFDRQMQDATLKLSTSEEGAARLYSPQTRDAVVANRHFEWVQSTYIAETRPEFAGQYERLQEQLKALNGTDAGYFKNRGALALINGDKALAADNFETAVNMMNKLRTGIFDPRRRGTVIEEDRGQAYEGLALQRLALNQDDQAFAAFEMTRARGFGELTHILARPDVTPPDREWLSKLLLLDAQQREIEAKMLQNVLTSGQVDIAPHTLSKLAQIRADRFAMLRTGKDAQSRLFRAADVAGVTLSELQKAAARSQTSIVLYWVTSLHLIEWYVGPHGSKVLSLWLPATVVRDKVVGIRQSAAGHYPFDKAAAQDLYYFLVSPFEDDLDTKQVLFIPQGPLVGLPFETLIEPDSGQPLIERWAVSYAPNAQIAYDMLSRPVPHVTKIDAVVDVEADDLTKESMALTGVNSLNTSVHYAQMVTLNNLAPTLAGSDGLHVLLHGHYNSDEPLLSELLVSGRHYMYAVQLINLPLNRIQLAVLSSCESGIVGRYVSNETFGFPWALLIGGAQSALVSRWIVDAANNKMWMQHFYSALGKSESPAMATADAMRAMRRDGHDHPYYWAAPQMSGR